MRAFKEEGSEEEREGGFERFSQKLSILVWVTCGMG